MAPMAGGTGRAGSSPRPWGTLQKIRLDPRKARLHQMAKRVGLRQDGGQNAAVKSFKQPAGAYSPYDPQAPRVKPSTSTAARKAAVAVENAIRHDEVETGVFIGADGIERLRRSGAPDRVPFTNLELSTKAGTTFTHNHPGNSSFTLDDYDNALFAGVAELRAVTPQFRHILVMGPKMPDVAQLQGLEDELMPRLANLVQDMIKQGQLGPPAKGVELKHQFWREAARRHGFFYTRERS